MGDIFNGRNDKDDKASLSGRKPENIVKSKPSNKNTAKSEPMPDQVTIRKKDTLIVKPGPVQRLLIFIYKNLYIIGVQVLRKIRKYRRNTKRWFIRTVSATILFFEHLIDNIVRYCKLLARRIKVPFTTLTESWTRERENMQRARARGRKPTKFVVRLVVQICKFIWRILSTILNYAAPILAGMFFITIVTTSMRAPIGLEVTYAGENIGLIKNEREFTKAIGEVDGRLAAGAENQYTASAPLYQVVDIKDDTPTTSQKDMANSIISASGDEITEAYGLYANDELVGVVKNGDAILDEMDRIKSKNLTGKPEERVDFDKSIVFSKALFPTEKITTEQKLIAIINSTETEDEVYVAQRGDTVQSIASSHGLTSTALKELNPGIDFGEDVSAPIAAETDIYLSRARKFLSIKNIFKDVYVEPLAYDSVETQDPLYAIGYRKVTSPGVPGVGKIEAEVTIVDGVEIGRLILDMQRLKEPISEQVTVGANSGAIDNGTFMWPGRGGFVGTVLGGYPGHTGVDINGTGGIGSPVYASSSGTVIKAVKGYSGYGHYVEIQHSDGFTTLYAHNSALFVSVGDYVSQGQIIAEVGVTGNSSGPHIHFELKQFGRTLNPTDYIGRGNR